MQKSILLLSSLFTIVVMNLVLSSCKDDEPFVKPKLSFDESTMTVNEAAGTIEVDVQLDKAYSETVTVEYELAGTATEGTTAQSDYEVLGDFGEVQINAGETVGTIELEINPDLSFEGNETIEISIEDVDNDNIEITNDDKIVITITDDDVRAKLSFAAATLTANEVDRTIQVQVVLDKAVETITTVQFALSGTAIDSVKAETDETGLTVADYQVKVATTGEFPIPSGQTTASFTIKAYSDFFFEDDETIIITLQGAGAQVEIGTVNEIEITLAQEDGKAIVLFWDENYTTVDMDLFLWIGDVGDPVSELEAIAFSTAPSVVAPEFVFIPDVFTDAAFGTSYNYYEGDEDPMDFEVQYVDFVNGVAEPVANRDIYTASYTLANINAWDQTEDPPIIVQTFEVVAGVYSTPSAITVPTTGSRIASPVLGSPVTKQGAPAVTSERVKSLIKKLK